MKIHIENTYADGYESQSDVEIADPDTSCVIQNQLIDDWWEEEVFPHTGSGHTDDDGRSVDAIYEATIVEAADPALVGLNYEWGG